MNTMIKPSDIANVAEDIVTFAENQEFAANDRKKILEMVRDYYQDKNEHVHEQYLAALCVRVLDRSFPQTGFEDDQG